MKKITTRHRTWLSSVNASKDMSFSYLDITPRRLEILEEMGLIEYKGGLYVLTQKGKNELTKL